jgi:predicted PurR-regulated permease PerM
MTKSERNPITFDSFVRGFLGVLLFAGIVMLLNRLSSVLVPFFLAWLIAYLMFPLVKFFQYRCHLKYRIVGILLSFLVVGLVLTGVFMLMVPPMVEESLRVKDLLVAYLSHSQLVNNIPDAIEDFVRSHLSVDDIKGIVTQDGFMDGVKATLPKVWDVITQSISVVSSMFSLTMVLLYTLFILLDYEVICRSWPGLIPERYRHFAVQLVADVEDGMNKYFR